MEERLFHKDPDKDFASEEVAEQAQQTTAFHQMSLAVVAAEVEEL